MQKVGSKIMKYEGFKKNIFFPKNLKTFLSVWKLFNCCPFIFFPTDPEIEYFQDYIYFFLLLFLINFVGVSWVWHKTASDGKAPVLNFYKVTFLCDYS